MRKRCARGAKAWIEPPTDSGQVKTVVCPLLLSYLHKFKIGTRRQKSAGPMFGTTWGAGPGLSCCTSVLTSLPDSRM